jgi:hypothetical protein
MDTGCEMRDTRLTGGYPCMTRSCDPLNAAFGRGPPQYVIPQESLQLPREFRMRILLNLVIGFCLSF